MQLKTTTHRPQDQTSRKTRHGRPKYHLNKRLLCLLSFSPHNDSLLRCKGVGFLAAHRHSEYMALCSSPYTHLPCCLRHPCRRAPLFRCLSLRSMCAMRPPPHSSSAHFIAQMPPSQTPFHAFPCVSLPIHSLQDHTRSRVARFFAAHEHLSRLAFSLCTLITFPSHSSCFALSAVRLRLVVSASNLNSSVLMLHMSIHFFGLVSRCSP